VVTYGDLGRDLGCGGFRLSFGLVKEIVAGVSSLEQARLREWVGWLRVAPRAWSWSAVAPDHPQARVAYVPPSLAVGSVSGVSLRVR